MSLSMYQASVPVFTQMLTSLLGILDKAAAHGAAMKWDPTVPATLRLIPDMLPFNKQIQIASDHAKRCTARLAGVEPPKYEDNEVSIPEFKARVAKTLDYLKTFTPAQIDGSEDRQISFPSGGGTRTLSGQAYLLNYAMPNFYFHATTAYAILREAGVVIGKQDYVGSLPGLSK